MGLLCRRPRLFGAEGSGVVGGSRFVGRKMIVMTMITIMIMIIIIIMYM